MTNNGVDAAFPDRRIAWPKLRSAVLWGHLDEPCCYLAALSVGNGYEHCSAHNSSMNPLIYTVADVEDTGTSLKPRQ